MTSAFEADTVFKAVDDQRFLATITDRWNGLHGRPLGGYSLAVALQPLRSQMPFPDLLVSSAFFLRPVLTGPVEVRTEIIRLGRRTATGETRLFQDGKEATAPPQPSPACRTRTKDWRSPSDPRSPRLKNQPACIRVSPSRPHRWPTASNTGRAKCPDGGAASLAVNRSLSFGCGLSKEEARTH